MSVDWYDSVDLIGQLLGHSEPADRIETSPPSCSPCCGAGALLDGWTDDWNAYARDTYRELRLDALDVLVGAWAQNG